MSKALVYADVNLNIVDGSSIWLTSIAQVMSNLFDEVHVQLKAAPQNDRLYGPLDANPKVTLHMPPTDRAEIAADQLGTVLAGVASRLNPDIVLVRGINAANSAAQTRSLYGKLWSYVTELPFPPEKISDNNLNRLTRIATRSERMLAQTESARSYLESIVPAAAGKTILMPPMVPDQAFELANDAKKTATLESSRRPLSIVYAGKLARDWKTMELLGLPRALASRGLHAELTIVGDKFNRDHADPTWVSRMQCAVEEAEADPTSGVRWVKGATREESLAHIASADLGIGWRTPALDSGLELSTKALEYAACGVPPVLNRNSDHLERLGNDYPFLVAGDADVDQLASVIETGLARYDVALAACHGFADRHSMREVTAQLEKQFVRAGVLRRSDIAVSEAQRTKVLIASHDLKFMGELMDYLERSPDYELRVDRWQSLHVNDEAESAKLLKWADVVFCEWAGPNLKWYSQKKRPGTKLISRLHRFELDGPWLRDVDWSNVDEMVFVSELYRRMGIEQLGLSPSKARVITNTIDIADFDRPKLPNAQFNLGFVGMVPYHKRVDRAVLLLRELLLHDERYVLHVKSRMPWDYDYVWNDPTQRQLYLEFFRMLKSEPQLREHVVFHPFGADIASWHRMIGFTLSPSEVESFHMAPAEGMAARTIPIFWDRLGVDEIFGPKYAHSNAESPVAKILRCRDPEMFEAEGRNCQSDALKWDIPNVLSQWKDVLNPKESSHKSLLRRWA